MKKSNPWAAPADGQKLSEHAAKALDGPSLSIEQAEELLDILDEVKANSLVNKLGAACDGEQTATVILAASELLRRSIAHFVPNRRRELIITIAKGIIASFKDK